MRGSRFPDGVTVDQVALRRTELTKAQEILRNRVDWTCRGVFSGGLVTVNLLDNTRIDVMQASGFAPNGEYIETDSPYYSIALADYAVGVVNYVCLVYTEADSYRQPHESDGERYFTRSEMAWRVRIYSAAQYALLPASDENLANDAQDRIIFFAKITANGVGVALTPSSIESPRTFNNIMYTVPRKCAVVLGVDILSASAGSPLGAGTLTYNFTPGTPPTYQLTWSTSNGAGAMVPIPADGNYTLLDGAGESIVVKVALAVLPVFTVVTTLTETITIFNLYFQEMPRLSAEDHLHRNYIGTGVVSPQNPHGNSLDDFSGESFSLLDEHQDVLHCNGIWRGSAPSLFQITVLNNPGADTFNLVPPTGGDLYYINGIKLNDIDQFLSVPILPPVVQSAYFYEICVSDEATVECHQKAAYPAGRLVTGTWIVDMSPNYPFGSYALTCTTTPGPFTPRVFTWDGGKPVTFTPLSDPSQAIRLYAADGEHWIDLWVNTNPSPNPDEALPLLPGTVSDTITVFASLTDGSNQFMQIGAVLYWWDAASVKWVLGYHPVAANRNAVDKRIWGNTGTENMATWALDDLAYLPNNELGRSGALLRRNGVYNEFQYTYGGAGFNISVNGGSFYCRGQRISVKSTQNLIATPSAVQLIWVDMAGVYQIANVTGTFGGDLQAAMRYVLGFTQNVPSVSSAYHYSDPTDAPERGVLLYYLVTDATDIDPLRIVDFTQNVNRVDDPWSVASRISATAVVHSQAAYDNLFTAFEYARYSMYTGIAGTENGGSVTVTVTGIAEIGFQITQPEYVNVRGTRGFNTPAKCLVRASGVIDPEGSWLLSKGCKVSDLSFYNDNSVPLISLSDYTTVENCLVGSRGGPFLRANPGAATQMDFVTIKNNTLAGCVLLFAAWATATNGYNAWTITGNKIFAVPVYTLAAIQIYNLTGSVISDNVIVVPDSGDLIFSFSGGIRVASVAPFQSREIAIKNNYIRIGNATGAVNSVIGIHLYDIWMADVGGNVISGYSIPTAQYAVGLYIEDMTASSVTNNYLNTLGGGILQRGECYDVTLSGNKLTLIGHVGIDVVINSFGALNAAYGLNINDNTIYTMVKGLNGGLFMGGNLVGIGISSDLQAADSALQGVSVSRNVVAGLGSNGNVYAVWLDIDVGSGPAKSFEINDNMMTTLVSTSGAVHGICVEGAANYLDLVSICRNQVFFTVHPANLSTFIYGIADLKALSHGVISGNSIYIDGSDTAEGQALFAVGNNLIISDNVLFGRKIGAYVSPLLFTLIANNVIYSTGLGLYLLHPQRDTVVRGNTIRVDAHNELLYAGDGSHCIAVGGDSDPPSNGITIQDCTLFLFGVGAPQDVFGGSACIRLFYCRDVFIEGCKMFASVETVEGGAGSAPRAYLVYYNAGHEDTGVKSTLTVKGCMFDDRFEQEGTTETPLHSLFITHHGDFDHAGGDQLSATITGNTFYTSCTQQVGPWTYSFNEEAVGFGGVAPALAPYVIYVSYTWGDEASNFVSRAYFTGNAIHAYPYQGQTGFGTSRARVYMPMHDASFPGPVWGICVYAHDVECNFVSYHGKGGMTSPFAWVGEP